MFAWEADIDSASNIRSSKIRLFEVGKLYLETDTTSEVIGYSVADQGIVLSGNIWNSTISEDDIKFISNLLRNVEFEPVESEISSQSLFSEYSESFKLNKDENVVNVIREVGADEVYIRIVRETENFDGIN